MTKKPYKLEIKWLNLTLFIYLHIAALYGMIIPWKWASFWVCFVYTLTAGFGTTVAAHRYFTHKSFKANKKLRWILIYLQTACAQEPILHWARDHRVHHKFTDTDADPYNSQRGFFFSHIGWLLCKKHPEVIRQGKKIDMSDLECDPMLQFQKRLNFCDIPLHDLTSNPFTDITTLSRSSSTWEFLVPSSCGWMNHFTLSGMEIFSVGYCF